MVDFQRRPVFFRNTELIYNNEIASFVRCMGFKGIVSEGWEDATQNANPNFVYNAKNTDLHDEDLKIANSLKFTKRKNQKIKLLLKTISYRMILHLDSQTKNGANTL
jgi:hypothetical protein